MILGKETDDKLKFPWGISFEICKIVINKI